MEPAWVQTVIQCGAVGILGYHLLWGLPRMLKEQAETFREILTSVMDSHSATDSLADARNAAVVQAVQALTQQLPLMCRFTGPRPPS
jgi:hypothetical protein